MTQAKINPAILRWARQRLGLTEAEVARKVGLKDRPERLQMWERGENLPTFRQAQELARTLRIPFGYLFLTEPPATSLPVPDFRVLPESEQGLFSPDLEDVLNDALRKQEWLRERRIQEGYPPLPFIGRFSWQAAVKLVSDDIRQVLALPLPTARDAKSAEEHLRTLVQHAEQAGIVILQSGYVGSNTRRTLSVTEFRGFALADPYAPLVFINARDTVNGRIFTLAHELAHLWAGTTGISNPRPELTTEGQPGIERWCNQVAAELLLPGEILAERRQNQPLTIDMAQKLAREFRVSVLVVLIRGYEIGILPEEVFRRAYAQALQEMQQALAKEPENANDGGDFYRNLPKRHGRLLLGEVAHALREGSILYQEASQLLNVTPQTLETILHEY